MQFDVVVVVVVDLYLSSQLETVTIEEQQHRPTRCCTPALPVRQVKIRSRPSSCFDLHKKEANGKQSSIRFDFFFLILSEIYSTFRFLFSPDNQWTKIVDERKEEHYDWHYNITLPLDRTSTSRERKKISIRNFLFFIIVQRDSSSTFFGHHETGTRTNDDLRIPITSKPG